MKKTLLMGAPPKKTLTGVPAQANKPQLGRVDVWGKIKPIGSYTEKTDEITRAKVKNVSH